MFTRTFSLLALSLAALAQTQSVEGPWAGTLDTGAIKLKVVLHLARDSAGAYSSKVDSPDQGATGIPIQTTTVSGDSLKLDAPTLQASYDAKFSADGKTLSGTWTQGGASFTLNLSRTTSAALNVPAQKGRPLTDAERQFLIGQLQRSQKVVADATAGLSEAQVKFKPAPDRWSVLEIVEHLAAIEDLLFGFATGNVMKIPPRPELAERTPETLKAADQKMLDSMLDRSRKGKAPETAIPTGKFATLPEAIEALKTRRAKVMAYVGTTQDDLRSHASPAPGGQFTDAYQFLLVLAGHADRHTLQINEVKATSGFPK